MLIVTKAQMEKAYHTIPETEEQARLTLASFESRELIRDGYLRKPAEEATLVFYTLHPTLLHGRIIVEADIASYLGITRGSLQAMKKLLIKKRLLPEKE